MKKVLLGAFLVTVIAATPARAQDERTVHLNIGGGFTMPLSDVSDRFGTGGGFNIGVIFEPPASLFGFQVEYSFNSLDGEDLLIPLGVTPGLLNDEGLLESHHEMHYINFNGMLRTSGTSRVKGYAVGGGGAYYRTISLTTPDVGFTTFCDPFSFVCFPTAVEVDRVVGDRNSWDPGVNFGGGITIGLGEEAEFYVETRWHYIWGPEFTDVGGVIRNANGQYLPVTFGFRF
jgi:hypothetical protein